MLDADGKYHGVKRAVILFSVITLVLCAKGTEFNDFSIAGISFSGISLALIKTLIFVGATYYFILFLLVAFLEVQESLIASDNNEASIEQLLKKSLERIAKYEEELVPIINYVQTVVPNSKMKNALDRLEHLAASGKIVVSPVFPTAISAEPAKYGVNFYNFISALITNTERKHPEVTQFNFLSIRDEALHKIVEDGKANLEAGIQAGINEFKGGFSDQVIQAAEEIDKFAERYDREVMRIQGELKSLKEPINTAMLQIFSLKSARMFKFWVMEGAAVTLLFLVATFHFIGEWWPILPTPIG